MFFWVGGRDQGQAGAGVEEFFWVSGLVQLDQLENSRENQQLHYKINKLERMMEDVHYTTIQRPINHTEKMSFSQ